MAHLATKGLAIAAHWTRRCLPGTDLLNAVVNLIFTVQTHFKHIDAPIHLFELDRHAVD